MSDTKNIEKNMHHIDENTREIKNNTKMIHILYIIIIVLMMIIAGLAFYVGTMFGTGGNNSGIISAEDIIVRIIDDVRCTECQTAAITGQIKALPFLNGAEFVEEDFSDPGVEAYLEANDITTLPAVIFSTNLLNDGGQVSPYLTALPEGDYSLALGSSFDPYATRSERGFLVLDNTTRDDILGNSYYTGAENAEITWIEYTDLNCFYCQKMEEDGTATAVLAKYPETLNKTTHNFIGTGGQKTQIGAEILECVGSISGSDAYNALLAETLISKDSSQASMFAFAIAQGTDETGLQECFDNGDSKEIVAERFENGREVFGVTGTPGNIIINNETGEYTLVSGAVPATTFEQVIDSLLQ